MELNTDALLKDEHIDKITAILKRFIYNNPGRLHFHVPQEISVVYAKMKNATISSVSSITWQSNSQIGFDVELSAVIITGSRLDADGTLTPNFFMDCSQKFLVSCSGTLSSDQELKNVWVDTIRIKTEKRYTDDSVWGKIIHAHQDEVKTALSAYILRHPDALHLPTPPWVEKVERTSLRSLDITWAGNLVDKPGMNIGFKIVAAAEINATERNKRGSLGTSAYQQWFTLKCHGNLEESLQDFSVDTILIEAVTRSEDSPMGVIVPFVSERQLELDALKLLKKFGFSECIRTPQAVDPALLAQRMGLTIQYRRLSKDKSVFGAVFMEDGEASFYRPDGAAMEPETVQAGTILIDEEASQKRPAGSVNNTIVHECVHWHRHRKAYYLARLIAGKQPISCLVSGSIKGGIAKSLFGMEWQATALAPRIQMPYPAFRRETRRLIQAQREISPYKPLIDLLPSVIERLAERFQVSKQAAKIRLLETKYPEARGVLEYVDGRYVRPYAFAPRALEDNQTFTVSAVELAQLHEESEELRALLQSGEYTVVESHVCLNDPRYVFGLGGGMPMLTEYARLHVDECCLKFAVELRNKVLLQKCFCGDAALYRPYAFPIKLRLEDDNKIRGSYHNSSDESLGEKCVDITRDTLPDSPQAIKAITDHMKKIDTIQDDIRFCTFPDAIEKLIAWRGGITQQKLAERTGLSVKTIEKCLSKSKGNGRLDTIFRLCIGLQLPFELSTALLKSAGYALNASPKHRAYEFVLRYYYAYDKDVCIRLVDEIEKAISSPKK